MRVVITRGKGIQAIGRTFLSSSSISMQALSETGRENIVAEPPSKMQRTAEPTEVLRVKRLSEHAILPKRGSAGAAGYDLARRVGRRVCMCVC